MMNLFRRTSGTGPYFKGWHWKRQNRRGQTLALIPACHIDSEGGCAASPQIISKNQGWSSSGVAIRQGKYRLEVELPSERRQPLRAPVEGRMERTIHESLCAEVLYRFWRGDTLLFQHTGQNASFEYA